MLAAQQWTATLLTLDDTRPAGNGVAPGTALGDLGIVASWVLRQRTGGPVRRLRRAGAGRLARMGPAAACGPAASPAGSRPPAPR